MENNQCTSPRRYSVTELNRDVSRDVVCRSTVGLGRVSGARFAKAEFLEFD